MTELRLLGCDHPEWDALIGLGPHDTYHRAAFHKLAQEHGEGEPFLAVAGAEDRGVAWPYLLRSLAGVRGSLRDVATDISSVYGYPGPVIWGVRLGDPFFDGAISAMRTMWRDQGAVSVFSRFNPILENHAWLTDRPVPSAVGGLVAGGETVSMSLLEDDETARAGYAPNLRREIGAARRAGLHTVHDLDWSYSDDFLRLYAETMSRSGAGERYDMDAGRLVDLRTRLGDRLHHLVTFDGDVIAAAGLFMEEDGIVQTHLVGTRGASLPRSPYKVLLDDTRAWARSRGNRVLHLGGGRGGDRDSLFFFKSRFSSRRHAFVTGRWILDPVAYEALTVGSAGNAGGAAPAPAGDAWKTGFFPAYRAP